MRSKAFVAVLLAGCLIPAGCASASRAAAGGAAVRETDLPGRTIRDTLTRAIAMLEQSQCEAFAAHFLSPIKLAQVKDLDAYRKQHACTDANRANIQEVLLALRLARGAEPVVQGIKATIDLSGIGIRITKFDFVKYIDGRWYFNEL
jgi:hypothetical protein